MIDDKGYNLEMEITAKEGQEKDESDSQMYYDEEINMTKKRIETKFPMATHGRKYQNTPKEKVTRKRTTLVDIIDKKLRETAG